MAKHQPMVAGIPEDLAFAGVFNRFFDKEHLKFDGLSGTFKIVYNHQHEVAFEGDSPQRFWIEKALARKGFRIVDAPCSRTISSVDEEFRVETSSGKFIAKDIAGIIDYLSQ
jgi:hypothetical protein